MIKLKQDLTEGTFTKPIYVSCPYCHREVMFFYATPSLCVGCMNFLKIDYLSLYHKREYRIKQHFAKGSEDGKQ